MGSFIMIPSVLHIKMNDLKFAPKSKPNHRVRMILKFCNSSGRRLITVKIISLFN